MVFSQKTVFVGGKGGVGKSVASAALAAVQTQSDDRVLLVQIGHSESFETLFHSEPLIPGQVVSLAPSILGLQLDLHSVALEFLERHLPVRLLADKIANSELFKYWTEATPMLAEVLIIGKIWKLATSESHGAECWDKIIVETPATGHGLALLGAAEKAHTMLVGPMKATAQAIVNWLQDGNQCSYALVSLAEEMVTQETVELHKTATQSLGIDVSHIFLNGCCPNWTLVTETTTNNSDSSESKQEQNQQEFIAKSAKHSQAQLARIQHFETELKSKTHCDIVRVPYVPTLQLAQSHVQQMAEAIRNQTVKTRDQQPEDQRGVEDYE